MVKRKKKEKMAMISHNNAVVGEGASAKTTEIKVNLSALVTKTTMPTMTWMALKL